MSRSTLRPPGDDWASRLRLAGCLRWIGLRPRGVAMRRPAAYRSSPAAVGLGRGRTDGRHLSPEGNGHRGGTPPLPSFSGRARWRAAAGIRSFCRVRTARSWFARPCGYEARKCGWSLGDRLRQPDVHLEGDSRFLDNLVRILDMLGRARQCRMEYGDERTTFRNDGKFGECGRAETAAEGSDQVGPQDLSPDQISEITRGSMRHKPPPADAIRAAYAAPEGSKPLHRPSRSQAGRRLRR